MREPRAILRSILRSYALRGFVGFGVFGLIIAVPQLLASRQGEDVSIAVHALAAIVGTLALVLGPAVAAALLVDDKRGWRRVDAALVFGALFLLSLLASVVILFLVPIWVVDQLLKPSQPLLPDMNTNVVFGAFFGASMGLAVGFSSLSLRSHQSIGRMHGFRVWLSSVIGFFIGGTVASVLKMPYSLQSAGARMEILAITVQLTALALGGLLFGLGLDYLKWKSRARFAGTSAETSPDLPTPQVPEKSGWLARGLLASAVLVVVTGVTVLAVAMAGDTEDMRHQSRGYDFMSEKRYADAVKEYGAAARVSPKDAYLRSKLAEAYDKLGQFNDAVREFNAAIQLDPKLMTPRLRLTRMYLDTKRYDDAARESKEMVRIKPTSSEAHICLGEAYARLGRNEDGDREFKEAKRLSPKGAFAHYALAHAFENLSRYDEAIKEYEEAVVLAPYGSRIHYDLARLCEKLKRYDEAIHEYNEVIRLQPSSVDGHYGLGEACIAAHDKANAMKQYGVLKTLDPARAEGLLKDINKKP